MKKVSIENKSVVVYLDGGWESSGFVIKDKKDRIVIKSENNDIILIFKNKISALKIIGQVDIKSASHDKMKRSPDNKNFFVFKPKKESEKIIKSQEEIKSEDLSDGGVSLPQEVLLSSPIGHPKFSGRTDIDNDFSMSLSSLRGGNSRISVLVKDD